MLVALACATTGRPIDEDSIAKIRPGVSTQADVERWFGRPEGTQITGSGRTRWHYVYVGQKRRDTGTITRIGRSIASIFGFGIFFPPVDLAFEETERHTLDVFFDPSGRVIDYSYQREKVPTKRVY